MRQKNAQADDEAGRVLDGISAELSGTSQATQVKRNLLSDNERRLSQLSHEVRPALLQACLEPLCTMRV